MEFLRKSLMVANRVMTKVTSIPTCSSIVSRYSVDIEFLIAELNDLNIMACDVVNAYLNAPCRENIWSTKYVVENRIDHEPEFAWWVPLTLRKQNMRVSKLQNKYWCMTHKFGIEVPTSVKQLYKIGDKNGTLFRRKSISK